MAMPPKEKQKMLEEKAAKMLEECYNVTLASINEDGFPRICVITKRKANGFLEIYFETGKSSRKTKHFLSCNKASVCFHNGGDSVTLLGFVEIVEDMNIKREIWKPDSFFKKGPEIPTYCVLKFKTTQATFWIGGKFGTYKYKA